MDNVRRSQSSDVLSEAEEVSAFLLELAHFFHEWRFTLPDVLILLLVTLRSFFFSFTDATGSPSSVRWSSCVVAIEAKIYKYLRTLLGSFNTVKFKIPYLASRSVRLVSAGPLTLLKRGYYIIIEVEVKAFILYHRKPMVNIPIQSLIIWPWLLLRKIIYASQSSLTGKLLPPVFMASLILCLWKPGSLYWVTRRNS